MDHARQIYQLPSSVCGCEDCAVLLTDRKKPDWQFLFKELADIPGAYDERQDYDFSAVDENEWRGVTVPSSLVTQGFNIENNTEYYYRRRVKAPAEFGGKRVLLHFESVYSNARVWIGSSFVGSHIGGFTPWDLDITDFIGGEFTLIIGVTDLEGDKASPWGPQGKYLSSAAWVSYYAHYNAGGILRDITMFCLPKTAILQTHIDTFLCAEGAKADVSVRLSGGCEGATLAAEILDGECVKAGGEFAVDGEKAEFTLTVEGAKLWDAEHPNLHTLRLTLLDPVRTPLQENRVRFGFREITYGGRGGTDKNKLYVNGREVKLRGVCRHDVSRLGGRSVPKEELYREIKTYKEHNINHIRTSHYPVSDYTLSLCDEFGIYVEQENAACFKGDNGYGVYCEPEDFLRAFAETVESSRNHPSVIIWSIANESGFEKSTGFRDCYNYIKATDLTRPAIFSYPFTVKSKPLPYDIFSKHYEQVGADLGREDMPILHDEFAHVPCYNTDELITDNSTRVFWGESIKKGWDNIFNTPGALGCDIWGAIDDVFFLPDKSMEKHQSHLAGECAGYGEWGCVLDAYKRLKPEAYLTKKAYSPVKINKLSIAGDLIRLGVQNRFDHTDMNEVTLEITNAGGDILYSGAVKESIAPHASGEIVISPVPSGENLKLSFIFGGTEVESRLLNPKRKELKATPAEFSYELEDNGIVIRSSGQKLAFVGGMSLYCGDKKENMKTAKLKKTGDGSYKADFGRRKALCLTVAESGGKLRFDIKPKPFSALSLTEKIMLSVDLAEQAESVGWQRDSLYDLYPDGHIARGEGTAQRHGKYHRYEETDLGNIPWEQSTAEYSYFRKNSGNNETASNDFKTARLNIKNYCVALHSGAKLLIETDSSRIGAYADPFDNKLKITKGSYTPCMAWGNYIGEKQRLGVNNDFSFELTVIK